MGPGQIDKWAWTNSRVGLNKLACGPGQVEKLSWTDRQGTPANEQMGLASQPEEVNWWIWTHHTSAQVGLKTRTHRHGLTVQMNQRAR